MKLHVRLGGIDIFVECVQQTHVETGRAHAGSVDSVRTCAAVKFISAW